MTKEIFQGKIIRLVIEPEKVNKKIINFEKVYLPGAVHIFVITDKGKVRLIKERRWVRGGKVEIKIPGGVLEKNEKPLLTAKRELKEEMGLLAKKWRLFFQAKQTGTVNDQRFYYLASGLRQGEAQPEEGEEILGYVDYSPKKLFNKAMAGDFNFSPTALAIIHFYDQLKKGKIKLR